MIKLKSILREAGLLKEQQMKSYKPVNFNFESGQHVLPPEEQQNINRVVSQVKDLVKRNSKIVDITIESSESQVPSKYPPGELAQKRAKAVKDQLTKQLPEYVNQINVVTKIGTTKYNKDKGDKAGDDKYKLEQYVRAVIKTDPPAVTAEPSRYLVVQPRPGSNSKYYNIVIPSDGYPNAVDYMSPEVAQRFITTHPHRTKIDKSTLLDFLRENGNGRVRVNLVAYPLYTVIVTNYDKELPSQSFKLHDWVLSNKLHQNPGANLFE